MGVGVMTDEKLHSAAQMAVDVTVAVDEGDQEKMIAFVIDEFAIVVGDIVSNSDELAAIIAKAMARLSDREARHG